jgi:NAD(P) transhydrogenase subunit alpha
LKVGSPKKLAQVALTPESAFQLQKLGHECLVESGAGKAARYDDDTFRTAGVTVMPSAGELWSASDVIIKVRPPEAQEVVQLGADKTLISFFYPGQRGEALNAISANALAMDMVPGIPFPSPGLRKRSKVLCPPTAGRPALRLH